MLLDLIATDNYSFFNIRLAHLIGLEGSVYINQLVNIYEKAERKQKITNSFITVDRDYIFNRTSIPVENQILLDNLFEQIGLIQKESENIMKINLEDLIAIITQSSESFANIESKIKKLQTKNKKLTKKEAILIQLKKNIVVVNIDLRKAYENWIDSVYNKDGWMDKEAVIYAQKRIDEFSNRYLDIALEILRIATINGYRDIDWAINNYKQNYRNKPISINQSIDNSFKIDTQEVF